MSGKKPDLLSDAERQAMDLTVQLVNCVAQDVIGHGPTRDADIAEFVGQVHAIQNSILSQAAARAYPTEYRLLGEII